MMSILRVFYIVARDACGKQGIQQINHRCLSMITPLILYFGGHDICSSKTQKEIIFHLHDNNCYQKAPQWRVTHILPIFLYFHVIHEVIKVMDVAWPSQSLASHGRVSFQSQVKLVFWWRNCHFNGVWFRNFHCTKVFLEKFPFYKDFGGETAIFQGFWLRNWHLSGALV